MPANQTTMDRLASRSQVLDLDAKNLRSELEMLVRQAQKTGETHYALVEVAAVAGDAIDFLHQSNVAPAIYWNGRNSNREYAALGATAVIRLSGRTALRDATERGAALLARCVTLTSEETPIPPRLFAGFAFEHSIPADPVWAGYDDALLILPELTIVSDTQGARASLTLEVQPQANVDELLDTLDARRAILVSETIPPLQMHLPTVSLTDGENDRTRWIHSVELALDQMRASELEKVVLARRIALRAGKPIPVWPVMRRLRDAATECFHFAFRMSAERVFVGASPERLFRLQGRAIETDCIAGTTERGADASADRELADALLASAKDRLEHYYVLEDNLRRLGDLCTSMNADTTPRIIKLSTLQHLATTARGHLQDGAGVGDILGQLHPTPAVGGTPRAKALAAIRELEPHSRGWYAGPVGWIERDRAEFAVAIRSTILAGADAYVFAGAGIVPGSVPQAEWQETQNKAQAFLKAVWG